jgi:3-deoxy-D-manno-octulosonic-acid transferase
VVSATTDTGFARATELFASAHTVVRYPFDPSWMVKRFLDRVQPDLVALTELELWPNFVDACTRRGIPIAVVNGRLSARSFKRYLRVRHLLAGTFGAVTRVLAQSQEYADRFAALGTPSQRVTVSGTMKWDTAQIADRVSGADELAEELGVDRALPIVVAGSTAPEEHALLHRAMPQGAQLICAPRKPEWFNAAAAAFPGCVRRSTRQRGSQTGRFLLDTIGELRRAYALADVVVIGRSFGNLYGSDMMEPAALAKAIVCGPRVGDFADTARSLVGANALVQVTAAQLPEQLARLVNDSQERLRLGERARAVVRSQQGATEHTALALMEILNSKSGTAHA